MSVAEVKSWMTFLGWTNGGEPGSRKAATDGVEIARHGDEMWKADVEHALKQIESQRRLDHIERVNRFKQFCGHSIYQR